jgi:hypothetical protein
MKKHQTFVLTITKERQYLHFKSIHRVGRSKLLQTLWKRLNDGDVVDLVVAPKELRLTSRHNNNKKATKRAINTNMPCGYGKFLCLHQWCVIDQLVDTHGVICSNLLVCEVCGAPKVIGRPRKIHKEAIEAFRGKTALRSDALNLVRDTRGKLNDKT